MGNVSSSGRLVLSNAALSKLPSDGDLVQRIALNAVHDPAFVEDAVKLAGSGENPSEYFLTKAERAHAKALISTYENGISAGVVEEGSKDLAMTTLSRDLARSIVASPEYLTLLRRRIVILDVALCVSETPESDIFWKRLVPDPSYRPETLPPGSFVMRGPDWRCVCLPVP